MGYINVPKLISGGSGGSNSFYRSMPSDWEYFKTLKEAANDQAYLMYAGCSGAFTLSNLTNDSTVTIYGGSNGTTPLYRYVYSSTSSNRLWYHWENNQWVLNDTQGTSSNRTYARMVYCDLDHNPLGTTFFKLTGKPITNDPHIGSTQLFTVIVHKPNAPAESNFQADGFYGGNTSSGAFAIPVIAYSGYSKGIKATQSNVNIPDLEFVDFTGGTEFNNYELYDNRYIREVTIPSTVEDIGSYFIQGSFVNKINFGSIKTLADYSMAYTNLIDVTLPNTLTSIGSEAFTYSFMLKKVTMPNSVTYIGMDAFSNCNTLEEITYSSGMTYIPERFLTECSSLREFNTPNGVKQILDEAFRNCKSLRKLELPASVNEISGLVFAYCYGLTYLKLNSTTAPTLAGTDAFTGSNTYMKILVPYDSITDYQTATNWSSTTNNIKTRQRGFGTFTQGTTLPATTTDGEYTLEWYDDLETLLKTAHNGVPSIQPITVAPADGEYYCTFS